MSDPNQPSTPAGWYPDGQGGQRWWDGTQWTEHTQPAQGAAPAAPAAPTPPADPTPVDPMQTVVAPRTPAQGFPAQGSPAQSGPGQPPSGPPPAQPGYQQPGQPGVPPWQSQTPASGGGGGGKGKLIAIIAGAVALVVIAAIVLFTFVLGGGPGDVAKDYLEAESKADLEQVCELSSKESREGLQDFYEVDDCAAVADKVKGEEDFEQGVKLLDDVNVDIEIGEVDEKGDSATVKYSEEIEYTGDDEEGFTEVFGEDTKFTTKGTITMVKEDGDWKVESDETED
ncbi:MAG: DUF2510 domain-containing protein [Nocardioides sp.]|nr:DUF2510 domain-containing protein [Nocardioides sp.]